MVEVRSVLTFLGMDAVIASEQMRSVLSMVERVARSNASVLIMGESGAGKELVARAVHHYSTRANKPWVDLSCAALPEHLIESELFGYEKGAFSGAESSKAGLFEMAHTGTIFLDEVGELEPRMQVKLLRVLDGMPYYRLGGTRKVTADVRVVAATNRNLQESVDKGEFRGDLYHRLSQFTLQVPPLRERVADIAPLAEHFLTSHGASDSGKQYSFTQSAIALMEAHDWPGNIRELRNAVISAAIWSNDGEIKDRDLQAVCGAHRTNRAEGSAVSLELVEKRAILGALASTGGHQQKAASRLGISRRTLHRKLKQYGSEELSVTL